MTAAMPQPEKMTTEDLEDIARFLHGESSKLRAEGYWQIAAATEDTAIYLSRKARERRRS